MVNTRGFVQGKRTCVCVCVRVFVFFARPAAAAGLVASVASAATAVLLL